MPTNSDPVITTNRLELRVRGEFYEMPGLRLTLEQASRLFNVESAECAAVLDRLVVSGTLRRVGQYYFRSDFGPLTT
jgi:hypothetical protein